MIERPDAQPRTDAQRLADHASIDRLVDDVVPALVAKLAASGLAEIEVREGDWHVRVRMPGGEADSGPARRAGPPETRRPPTGPASPAAPAAPAGPAAPDWEHHPTAGGGRAPTGDPERAAEEHPPRPRAVATSPAVGLYRPRPGVAVGSRVRAGDVLGAVDMLGVPHEVLAPADGVVGGSYVEGGEGVEYGQDLVRIELAAESAR